MKTIQMTIDEALLEEVDTAVQTLGTSRSAFLREAVKQALSQLQIRTLEHQHKLGYLQQPADPTEFDIWQDEQVWEDTE